MGKKNKMAEQLILESFEGSRDRSKFFKSMSDSEYIGYVTATVSLQNLSMLSTPSNFLDEARRLFREGKL